MTKSNRHTTKDMTFLLKKIFFVICIFFSSHGYAQDQYYKKLKREIDKLSVNSSNIQFISIDSFLNDKEDIFSDVENAFIKMNEVLMSNKFYLLKIGYYVKDSNSIKEVLVVFNKLKAHLQNVPSSSITKIDANCQNYLAVIDQASKYEDRTKIKLRNSIYFRIYKSKTRVQKLDPKKECYF